MTPDGTRIEFDAREGQLKHCLSSVIYEPWGGISVLETIIIVLLVLWLLGMVTGQSLGGMLWILLVVAAVLFVVRMITGRRAV